MRSEKWRDHQAGKIARALAAVRELSPQRSSRSISAPSRSPAALGYLDLRFEGAWRKDHPQLVAWLDEFAAAVPAFEATRMPL